MAEAVKQSPITAINHKLPAKIEFFERICNHFLVIIYNKKIKET